MIKMEIPEENDFREGIKKFEDNEKRDSMYKVSSFLINHFWGNPTEMADALGVLLLTWNQAFYRYSSLDIDEIERFIKKNLNLLEDFRKRDILTFSDLDNECITDLFNELLEASKIIINEGKVKKSPVSAAKALHLLAPKFFPLWDVSIAKAYNCSYKENPAEKYISFSKMIKKLAEKVKGYIDLSEKSLIKIIDQYNYSKFTKKWI